MPTATDLPTLESLRDEQRSLRAQLARLRGRLRLELALEFVVDAAVVVTATAAVLVFLDWWFRLNLPLRIALLDLGGLTLVAFLGLRAVRRSRSAGLDELSLAMVLDRHRPGTGQQIADVLQLPELLAESSASSSPAMVRLAVRQACAALADSDWRSLWNRKRTAAHVLVLLSALLVPVAFAAWAPHAARLSFARWLRGSNERWPQQTYLTVMGLDGRGRLLAPRDERFVLEVRSDLPQVESRGGRWFVQGRGEPLSFPQKPQAPRNPAAVFVRERTAEGAKRDGVMVASGPSLFRYEFPASPASSRFQLDGGDDWLGPLQLQRVDRPALASVRLRVKEPGTTSGDFRTIPDPRQHLLFLPDTEVELTLVGTEPIAETEVKFHPEGAASLKRIDDRTFAAGWTLREATTLEVVLTSAKTGLLSKPAFLSLGLLKDREPRVALKAVGVGSHVTPIATIPLTLAATDDIGLAALRLQVEKVTSAEEKGQERAEPKTERRTVPFPLLGSKERPVLDHQVRHDVVLESDPPKVGTVLRFRGEADDRCARGAQTGRSTVLQMQVVAPDELFYEILIRQRAERAKFIAILDSLEKQTPVLAGKPSREEFLRVMRAEHSGSRQLEQIAGRIADTLQEMKLNQIGAPKSHRLLQEGVIDPIRALTTGSMNELRGVLQALTGTSAKAGATKDVAQRLHDDVVGKMRIILDQMSQWESFVDVVNQVAEVIRMQQKVLQATEKARETRAQEVFDAKP